MLLAMLLCALLISGAALYLAVRVVAVVRQWREPTTRWVPRSLGDRRHRQVRVAVERRKGPRRQDDLARHFVTNMQRGGSGMAAAR